MSVLGEAVRLVAAGTTATFELSAPGFTRDNIDVQIISKSHVSDSLQTVSIETA